MPPLHLLLRSLGALPLQPSLLEVAHSDQLGLRCGCRARVMTEVVFLAPPLAALVVTCTRCESTWTWGQR